jgi:hypothetical protein
VLAAIDAARDLGLERVFCLTYQAEFFAKLGFTRVDRSRLPDKVWGECVRCHRFLDCDEVAMWRAVAGDAVPSLPSSQPQPPPSADHRLASPGEPLPCPPS